MPLKYATTSNVRYYENIMSSHVRHFERRSVISDCLVRDVRDVRDVICCNGCIDLINVFTENLHVCDPSA